MLTITTGRIQDQKKWQELGWHIIDVTVKSATSARSLAPTWDMVLQYKNGTLSEQQYTKKYQEILKKSLEQQRAKWLSTIKNYNHLVFLCYCPTGQFCHRLLVAKAFYQLAQRHDYVVILEPEKTNKV